MKKIILLLLCFVLYAHGYCQVKQIKYTPYLYVGASKADLVEIVVEGGKAYYRKNIDAVVNKQKKKGIKLKKKKDMDAFLIAMEKDIRTKLSATDDWYAVDLNRWFISAADMVGMGFDLPGFTVGKLDKTAREFIYVRFTKGVVSSIATTVHMASPWHTTAYLYNDITFNHILQVLNKNFGTGYTHSRQTGSDFLGEQPYNNYSETFNYADKRSRMNIYFLFKPFGAQNKAGNWRYLGTSLQQIIFDVSSRN